MARKLQILNNLTGKSAYEVAKDNGFEGTEAEWLQSLQGEPGKTDYTKLENKPTETIGGDTLEWDGVRDGLVSVNSMWFKVSDAVPTIDDFADGFGLVNNDSYEECEPGHAFHDGNIIHDAGNRFMIALEPNADWYGLMFPEAGTYFEYDEQDISSPTLSDTFTSALTIHGYTGFGKEVLKPKALPQHTHKWSDIEDPVCGESFGDTLTWDGNRGELAHSTVTDYPSYKCSDAVVTLEDIANGLSYTLSDGRTRIPDPNLMYMWMKLDSFIYDHFAFVNNEYAAENGYEPGIYLSGYEDAEGKYIYVKSLTIPGYTGFPVVKKLDAKYLPKANAIEDLTAAPTASDFNALLEALRNAGYLAT